MRMALASYAGRFPRYRRLMADAGFPKEVEAITTAWKEGNTQEALRLVPSALIEKIALVGTPEQYRERLSAYREAGITLPIISPRVSGPGAKERAMGILRACAPNV